MTQELNFIIVLAVFVLVIVIAIVGAYAYSTIYRYQHEKELVEVELKYLRKELEEERGRFDTTVQREVELYKEALDREQVVYREAIEKERRQYEELIKHEQNVNQKLTTVVTNMNVRQTELEDQLDKMSAELEEQRRRNWTLSQYIEELKTFYAKHIEWFESTYQIKVDFPAPPPMKRFVLFHTLKQAVDLNELQTLCFELGVKYENLAGDTFDTKLISFLEYMERNGRLGEIEQWGEKKRPEWRKGM